jgi:hypothetical protein
LRIVDECDTICSSRKLFEQFQPFDPDCEVMLRKPGDVATGARQAFDKARANRIGCANTIGMVWVAWRKAASEDVADAKSTSGCAITSSVANARMRSARPLAYLASITKFRPSIQPRFCRPSRMASNRCFASSLSDGCDNKKPMRRIRSFGCARPTCGHAAAAPPKAPRNSRRRISGPSRARRNVVPVQTTALIGAEIIFATTTGNAGRCRLPRAFRRFIPPSQLAARHTSSSPGLGDISGVHPQSAKCRQPDVCDGSTARHFIRVPFLAL